ncbi:MAG TPA: magnesium transporter [Phycisphaerales bacterium]|nr:magnesium transporter [Phycisphaerales bacterium]HRQ75686.1 magnesium transporter [Phycisphaerales bacterium]
MSVLMAPDIEDMLAQKRTHEARTALEELYAAEVADLLTELKPTSRAVVFRLLPREKAADVFTFLPSDQQNQLLDELTNEQLVQMFNEMDPDDRAELFDEMPGQLAARLLEQMRPQERRNTQIILGYPPESVGRIMTPEYVSIKPDWTVQQALNHIRHFGKDAEILYTIYVVDDDRHLLDEIKLRHLVMADPDSSIRTLMDEQVVSLNAFDDREEAVRAMERYDVPVLPVVDRANVMVGIVTFDDVADVAEEEVTEDFQKIAAVAPLTEPYLDVSLWEMFRKRGGWLAILFVGQMLTASVMETFETQLQIVAALVIFIPLIISSGGNSGSQATSLVIRAIALNDVTLRDWWRVLRREVMVALCLGLFLAVIGLARVAGWHWAGLYDYGDVYIRIAFTVAISLIGVVVWGSLVGSMLPFLLRRIGLDPATSSAPFVATLVDVTGLLIYFYTATFMLRAALAAA